ncbi:hypothetical protein KY290_034437 [Solanum tuberosum]|uniref:Disease resistance protein RGA3 n=1 Tax=Solanum tuberosum TaxID=4113 RepID=A0ABQ7U580_SOLTU|nr:hypothetical protein KY290_034437 [Solanum tuberosum]
MGGLGKTTLAQMVFNDKRVTEHFHPKIWICVLEDFNEKRLIKEIVEFIERMSLGDMGLAPLQMKLQQLLNGKRYLLVLDDVWNEDQDKWANLRAVLKVGASGASVLTTTRLEKVGSIMGTLQPFRLSNLSQEDCWLLFMQRAFGHQEEINPNLVAIGKEIVKKSGGVPLAAKTLGGILRFKREEREWEHARDNDIWNLPQEESIPKGHQNGKKEGNLSLDGTWLSFIEKKLGARGYGPPRIGCLTCLKTLDCFVVGERKGYQLGELRNLNLHGAISITHLDRMKKDKEAKEANLSTKMNLHSLSMSWNYPHRYESEEVKVLEALKPHPNLKYLTISGFRGFRLPNWMNHLVLKNVVSIVIEYCGNCSCLPPFGELPCLESLKLQYGCVEYVDVDVDSGFPTRIRFPSLRKLCIEYFHNLKGLMLKKEGEEQFPVLEEMEIDQCPVLEEMEIARCPVFVFPTLSSVKKLEFVGEADATGFRSISNLRALTSLNIRDNKEATSLPEEMFKNLANLKYLNISEVENLKELPTSLACLNAWKHLKITMCYAL